MERGKRLSAAEGLVTNLQSRCRVLEHKLLRSASHCFAVARPLCETECVRNRMSAAQDAASAAERVIKSAEDEVRQCLAEANDPFPFPDNEAGESSAQERSGTSATLTDSVDVPSVTMASEEVAELQRKRDSLSGDVASKETLVAKLQSQLDQLVQQLAEKRDAISDIGANR